MGPRELGKPKAGDQRCGEPDDLGAEMKALRVRVPRQETALGERSDGAVGRRHRPLQQQGDLGQGELRALTVEEPEHVDDPAQRLDKEIFR